MTGILIATVLMALLLLVGGFALFVLLPAFMALLGVLALGLVLFIVAVLLLPSFITLDEFKPQIIDSFKQATGREISIGGPIGFSVWPILGLQLRDISIGNLPGAADPIFMSAKELGVGITLSSLVDRRLELRELRVVGGQFNLAPLPAGAEVPPLASKEQPAHSQGKASGNFSVKDIRISRVEIVDTGVSYDPPQGDPIDLDDIDMAFAMPSLDQPATLQGHLTLRGREVTVEAEIGKLRAIMDSQTSPLQVDFGMGSDHLVLDGEVKGPSFKGTLNVAVSNLSTLAAWASGEAKMLPVQKLALQTALEADSHRAALSSLNLKLDDMVLSGTAGASWNGTVPKITGDLAVTTINLDKLMKKDTSAAATKASPAAATPASQGDSFAALDKVNADITAKLAGVTYQGVTLGASTARVVLQGGRLESSLSPASFFGGTVAANVKVLPPVRAVRSFNFSTTLDGVDVAPVLTKFADFTRLTGKADATVALSGPLSDAATLKRSLDGDGRFMLRDGVVKGVNLAALIRNAKALLGQKAAAGSTDGGGQQTDFAELSGSFRIADGVVSNNDLKLQSSAVRVSGKGTVNLPAETVDYRVDGALAADLAGQQDGTAIVIPINVRGNFSNLRYEPDVQGLVLGNIGAAKNIGAAVEGLNTKEGQRNARDAVKGLLGLEKKDTAPAEQTQPAKPVDVLKGLLGQ